MSFRVHPPLIISIHALREEGDGRTAADGNAEVISIHALREEGDNTVPGMVFDPDMISIHALREEGDQSNSNV